MIDQRKEAGHQDITQENAVNAVSYLLVISGHENVRIVHIKKIPRMVRSIVNPLSVKASGVITDPIKDAYPAGRIYVLVRVRLSVRQTIAEWL